MNHSTAGLPVHCQLPVYPLSRWCHPAISSSVIPFSSCPQSFPSSGSFPMRQLLTWGGQTIRVSASASVLPMNTQDWSPLGWISLLSKGLSRVFSNTTAENHQFFSAQLFLQNLPGKQETWIWLLGLEDTLEKEMATHYSILALRIPWRGAW